MDVVVVVFQLTREKILFNYLLCSVVLFVGKESTINILGIREEGVVCGNALEM